jgi:pimeloyl-ACP methyl ester carboxylesterase
MSVISALGTVERVTPMKGLGTPPVVRLFLAGLAVAGCQFADLDRDLKQFETFGKIEGRIVRQSASDGPVAVALFLDRLDRAELLSAKLVTAGAFDFIVPPGRYALFAFEDQNRDFRYQPGEPAGFAGDPEPVQIQTGENRSDLVIALEEGFELPERIRQHPEPESDAAPQKLWAGRQNIGAIATLGDPRFDEDVAKMGLWEPLRFSLDVGPGLYLLEPYTPAKIPVLFVHGINGSPRDWAPIIDRLDRDRFQPWFLAYASGLPLEMNARYLFETVKQLQLLHDFKELHLVAHSMGGLVSKSLLQRYSAVGGISVKSFITLSTPWAGHDAAQIGIDYAPAIVPAWRDLAPSSEFLATLRDAKNTAAVPHYLLFSYRSGGLPSRTANDGSVTVASQLDPAAQAGATRVYGFNVGHNEILSDTAALDKIFELLAPDRS